jgi:hypothetical protein
VAAANDGLIGVIGVQVKATTAEDLAENITGGCNALAGCASDAYGERLRHKDHPSRRRALHLQCLGTSDSSDGQGFYFVF